MPRSHSPAPWDFQETASSGAELPSSQTEPMTADELKRLAHLVAHGVVPVPKDLGPEQSLAVLQEVRRLRRKRLMRYIARSIALDLHAESGS